MLTYFIYFYTQTIYHDIYVNREIANYALENCDSVESALNSVLRLRISNHQRG